MATSTQKETIIELYTAYFGRAADKEGADFWVGKYDQFLPEVLKDTPNQSDAERTLLIKISEAIATSDEYIALYPPELSSNDFLEKVYLNLFDRTIDEEGKAFWLKHLDAGTMTKDVAIISLITAAKENTSEQGLLDTALLKNKTDISLHYVDGLESNNIELAKKAFEKVTSDPLTVAAIIKALDIEVAGDQITTNEVTGDVRVVSTDFLTGKVTSTVKDKAGTLLSSSIINTDETTENVIETITNAQTGELTVVTSDKNGSLLTTKATTTGENGLPLITTTDAKGDLISVGITTIDEATGSFVTTVRDADGNLLETTVQTKDGATGEIIDVTTNDKTGNVTVTTVDEVTGVSTTTDITAPILTDISAPSGTYAILDTVEITLTYNEAVIVDVSRGLPTLSLSNGTLAGYVSGSGHNSLVFGYQIKSGDTDTKNLDVLSINLNSGTITDAGGNTAGFALGIGVSLKSDATLIIKGTPAPVISSDTTASIDENIGPNTVIYKVTSNDPDATYSLNASDYTLFYINGQTGEVSLKANPDFETLASYNFTVIATDILGNAREQAIALTVNNVDEVDPIITSLATATPVNENSGENQVIYTVTSTDDSTVAYSLKAVNDGALFSINSSSGAIKLIANPDFVAKENYSFTVIATDLENNSVEKIVSLAVVDLESVAPTASLSYSIDSGTTKADTIIVKDADTLRVFATFNEAMSDSPLPTIAIDNSILLAATMTKESSTVYYYDLNVPVGDLTGTVTITNGKDLAGNVITANPSNPTFTIDNTISIPSFSLNSDSGTNTSDGITNDATIDVTGLVDDVASWEYKLKTANWVAVTDNSTSFELADNIAYSGDDIQVRQTDVAGNVSDIAKNTNSIVIDKVVPTLSLVEIVSSNSDTSLAKTGDIVTLSFTSSKTINTPTVLIGGQSATVSNTSNSYTATYTLLSSDTEGALGINIAFSDTAGNAGTNVTTATNSSSVTFDRTAPTLSSVGIASNNSDTSLAKIGDIVTLSFTSSETINTPTVTIGSQSASVTNSGNDYTATYTLLSSDTEGALGINIAFSDTAGNAGTNVTTATNSSSVTFDRTAPTLSSVGIASNNNDTTLAKIGDVVTLSFTSNEAITPTVTIGGKSATVTNTGNNYTATYTLLSTDTAGVLGINIAFSDTTGNTGTSVTAVTNSSSVTFDKIAPTLSAVAIVSNNSNTALAKIGDIVTLSFTSSESISTPTVTIDSKTAIVSNTSGNSYTATYTLDSNNNEGALGINIAFSDTAGNAGTNVTAVTDSSLVTFDKTTPAVTSVTSLDDDKTYAAGDTISINILFDEVVDVTETPTLTLETGTTDQVVNYTSGTGTNTLTFDYTVQAGDASLDLAYFDTSALKLNSGTITDASGNSAVLTLPTVGATGSLSNSKALVVEASTVDTSVVVFDLTTGESSDHSNRTFSSSVDYDIYIKVASASNTLVALDAVEKWKGAADLGALDKITLVGNGAVIEGNKGNILNGITKLSANDIRFKTVSANAIVLENSGTVKRYYNGTGNIQPDLFTDIFLHKVIGIQTPLITLPSGISI
ncbi:MAG: cadherin domain-containing protein [Methylococcales bacterium]|nr:cadherin domain-containing protein [Methylococcales bacterium]